MMDTVKISYLQNKVLRYYERNELGFVDNSSYAVLRPATCSRDPEILPNAQSSCTKMSRSTPREQVAGRRFMNCQQTIDLKDNFKLIQLDNSQNIREGMFLKLRKLYKTGLTLLALSYAPVIISSTPANDVQLKLNAIRTMSASFTQDVNTKKRHISHSSGTMALSRPARFRWQTKTPMAQLVVADGSLLWVYDKELEQVSVKKQNKKAGGAAALFLSEYNDSMTKDFDVSMQKEGKMDYFDLHAKSHKASFERIKLVFDGDALKAIELFDQLGQNTRIQLNQVKINSNLASSLFEFKVPKGVDVVHQ